MNAGEGARIHSFVLDSLEVTSSGGEVDEVVEAQGYLVTLKAYHMPGHQTGIAVL